VQITAIIFLPNFPGWLAPLAFNPTRFLEFFSFAATLLGTWVASGGWEVGWSSAGCTHMDERSVGQLVGGLRWAGGWEGGWMVSGALGWVAAVVMLLFMPESGQLIGAALLTLTTLLVYNNTSTLLCLVPAHAVTPGCGCAAEAFLLPNLCPSPTASLVQGY